MDELHWEDSESHKISLPFHFLELSPMASSRCKGHGGKMYSWLVATVLFYEKEGTNLFGGQLVHPPQFKRKKKYIYIYIADPKLSPLHFQLFP